MSTFSAVNGFQVDRVYCFIPGWGTTVLSESGTEKIQYAIQEWAWANEDRLGTKRILVFQCAWLWPAEWIADKIDRVLKPGGEINLGGHSKGAWQANRVAPRLGRRGRRVRRGFFLDAVAGIGLRNDRMGIRETLTISKYFDEAFAWTQATAWPYGSQIQLESTDTLLHGPFRRYCRHSEVDDDPSIRRMILERLCGDETGRSPAAPQTT